VHSTLRALVSDLEIRCDVLLASLPASRPAEIDGRVGELSAKVSILRSEALALLALELEDPSLAASHYQDYAELNRRLSGAEQLELPVLLRWAEPDRQITEMCSALLVQVGWSLAHPLVGTVSHDYYMALASRNIIYVPANEHQRLLAIGDLAHELGHVLLERESPLLIGDTPPRIMALAKSLAGASPGNGQRAFEVNISWLKWLPEFVCDCVAGYLTGPAFALQNLRLCGITNVLLDAYAIRDGLTHPPDDARMQVALKMLEILGMPERAASIGALWEEALLITGATRNAEYSRMFPEDLLEALARNVHAGCAQLGLRAYDTQISSECDVARVANQAWERLLEHPAGYAAWERERLAACRPIWSQRAREG
jgi:hypothetical protein